MPIQQPSFIRERLSFPQIFLGTCTGLGLGLLLAISIGPLASPPPWPTFSASANQYASPEVIIAPMTVIVGVTITPTPTSTMQDWEMTVAAKPTHTQTPYVTRTPRPTVTPVPPIQQGHFDDTDSDPKGT